MILSRLVLINFEAVAGIIPDQGRRLCTREHFESK